MAKFWSLNEKNGWENANCMQFLCHITNRILHCCSCLIKFLKSYNAQQSHISFYEFNIHSLFTIKILHTGTYRSEQKVLTQISLLLHCFLHCLPPTGIVWSASTLFVIPSASFGCQSGGIVMDNALEYQTRGQMIDPLLLWSFPRHFNLMSRICMTLLLVGH